MKLDTATNGMLYITLNEDECDKLNFGIKDIDTLFSGHNTVICGSCNSICNGSDIFYVPGLNEVYCQDCFDDMQKGMTHYDDKMSIKFEQRHCNATLKLLNSTTRVKWNGKNKKFDLYDIEG